MTSHRLPITHALRPPPLQENYDYKIFECLNPTGEVLPGETVRVQWVFSPLEAKIYKVGLWSLLVLLKIKLGSENQ